MKFRSLCAAAVLCSIVLPASGREAEAAEFGTDVSGYLGLTVAQVRQDFPDLYSGKDTAGSGRDCLTDGMVCFYYEYNYGEDPDAIDNLRVDRIVINGNCGAEYRIGSMPGGATYGDEYIAMTGMGYEFLWGTGDIRHFWMDDEGHLVIVTRGQWAGACEVDYSLVVSDEFYE